MMVDVRKVLSYIDRVYECYFEHHPEMHARDSRCLEEKCVLLEEIREFLLSATPSDHRLQDNPYYNFLDSEGFGVALFTHSHPPGKEPPSEQDVENMKAFVKFFRRYLSSGYRTPSPTQEAKEGDSD